MKLAVDALLYAAWVTLAFAAGYGAAWLSSWL